jgi:FkbM family methyltransferase
MSPTLSSSLSVLLWPSPSCIFEIGACEGEDTVKYAKVFPRARFWLFEPLPANFSKLQEVLSQHPEVEAKAFCLALSDWNGTATFHVSSTAEAAAIGSAAKVPAGHKSSSLLPPRDEKPAALQWLEFTQAIEVQTETLDDFCAKHGVIQIDFIHMDVQGAELKVLSGATRILPRIRAIWMEVAFEKTYEGQPLEPETTRWMAGRGFRKIHQVSYGPEGDALYYNMRMPLAWPRFVALRLLQKVGLLER